MIKKKGRNRGEVSYLPKRINKKKKNGHCHSVVKIIVLKKKSGSNEKVYPNVIVH